MLGRLLGRESRTADMAATLIAQSRGSTVDSGELVNDDTAMRLSTVWACVNLIARSVSTMPVDVVRYSADGGRESVRPSAFVQSPAAGMTFGQWVNAVMVSQLLRGNAYGRVTATSENGRYPTQIEPLHPDCVQWKYTRTANGYAYTPYVEGVPTRVWPLGDLWHLPAYTVPGSPVGLAPITYAQQAIGTGLAEERFAARFFGADGHPSSIIYSEREMNLEQVEAVKTAFMNATRGNRNPAVMGAGLKYETIQIAPEESQFLEAQRFSVEQVARFFGVAPEMIGAATQGSSLTYANREQRTLDFLAFTLNPWIVRLEEALTALLPRPQVVKFNTNSLLRADTKTRFEVYEIASRIQTLTRNEIRAFEDMPPLPDGDGFVEDSPAPDPAASEPRQVFNINADTTIADGAIRAEVNPGGVEVDARTTIEPGAINASSSNNPPDMVTEVASAVASGMDASVREATTPMVELLVERDAAQVDQLAAVADQLSSAAQAVAEASERMARPKRVKKIVNTDDIGRIVSVVEEEI